MIDFFILHHSGIKKLGILSPKYLKKPFISNGIF